MTIEYSAPALEEQLKELWQEAFGDPREYVDLFFRVAYSPRRCRVVLEEGRVLGAVYWLDCSCRGRKLAYIYALAVRSHCRGRGIGSAALDDVQGLLEQLGYAATVLVPGSQTLRDYYEKRGYRPFGSIREFLCTGAAEEVQLRRITAEDYALQRRELLSFLEKGPVLQEGENLALLAAQCRFYAGQNFLLAARTQEDTLVGVELLGDPRTAPGILQTLGYSQGTFRTRGEGMPFAMFRPLVPEAEPPTYFGLAFD